MPYKICLFTAHSPDIGGGSVIIKSLIENLPEADIRWNYLSDKPSAGYEFGFMGPGIMGSSLFKDVYNTFLMLSDRSVKRIDEIVKKLLAIECDSYWIISHNEGLRVAIELIRLQHTRPVHLTVHDDWAGALCARSFRYKFMAHKANKMTILALTKAISVDVVSRGMQEYYLKISYRKSEICHRYLDLSSIGKYNHLYRIDHSLLVVGHIGSIYDNSDLIGFLSLLATYGKLKGIKAVLNMWGYHAGKKDIPDEFKDLIKINEHLSEDKAIIELTKCNFVYCMYPQISKLRIFSKTSLPTKLTSYVQACRPIFGHGPSDSTLAEFLKNTDTGVMWTSNDLKNGLDLIEELRISSYDKLKWIKARDSYFGSQNLKVMSDALINSEVS
jgi:hypothetical protein